jgi:hypothetical protein
MSSIEMPAAVNTDTFIGDELATDQEELRFSDFRSTTPSLKRCGFDHLHVLLRIELSCESPARRSA